MFRFSCCAGLRHLEFLLVGRLAIETTSLTRHLGL